MDADVAERGTLAVREARALAAVDVKRPIVKIKRGCLLCAEMTDLRPLSGELGLYTSRAEKMLFESDHFAVIPDISPLVPGHRLLITREHFDGLADLPRSLWAEFEHARQCAVSALTTEATAVALFEHGSARGKRGGGACVNHTHLHLVPLPAHAASPPFETWAEDYGDVRRIDRMSDVVPLVEATPAGYLLWEHSGEILMALLREPVPCQFMRLELARHLGLAEWNWKSVLMDPGTRPGGRPA